MRDRIAFAFLLFVLLAAAGGIWLLTDDLPDENVPDATFEVAGDAESGELIVEHADGESFESGQRVVIRWFGGGGQANVYETTI